MQKTEIQYFDNTIKDISGRLIPETALQDSLNILFAKKKVKNRYGIYQLEESLPSEVLKVETYKQLYSDNTYIVAFTKSDVFFLDFTGKWKYITRNVNYGTVAVTNNSKIVTLTPPSATIANTTSEAVSAGDWYLTFTNTISTVKVGMVITTTITGITSPTYVARVDTVTKRVYLSQPVTATINSGTSVHFQFKWKNAKWNKKLKYEICFGATDVNSLSNVWRKVDTVDSVTQITLETVYNGTTNATSTYCLRLCYDLDEGGEWSVAFPYDESMPGGGDKAMVFTNGIDFLQKWTGFENETLTYCDDVYNYPNLCKNVAFYGTIGSEHLLCSNVYDTANSSWNSTVIEVSDAGELSWEDGATYPLFDSQSPIRGVVPLATRFVIYKEKSISIAQATYSTNVADPFSIQQDVIRGIGAISIETVCDTGKLHIFFTGERIAVFDGFNYKFVDDGVNLYISRLVNISFIRRSYAFLITELNLYCLAVPTGTSSKPDMIIVFNYEENSFTFWRFENNDGSGYINIPACGKYIISYSPTWYDLIVSSMVATASNSSTVNLVGIPTADISMGMRFVPSGYSGTNLYIKTVTVVDATHVTITVGTTSDETSVDPSLITLSAITLAGVTSDIGYTDAQNTKRWIDLVSEDSDIRNVLCDTNGNIFELSKFNAYDTINAVQSGINSTFETKDFEFNKGLTCLIQEITIRAELFEQDATSFYPGSFDIFVSVDYGYSWTLATTLPLDGNEPFMEKKVALHLRGKALRFRVVSNLPFQFENCFIGFNINGKSFKYDR